METALRVAPYVKTSALPLLELPGIVLPGKRKFREVFRLYAERNISFADAYHVVMMRKLELTEIVSFDRGFGPWWVSPLRVEGIILPSELYLRVGGKETDGQRALT
jgi:hypothetical protein